MTRKINLDKALGEDYVYFGDGDLAAGGKWINVKERHVIEVIDIEGLNMHFCYQHPYVGCNEKCRKGTLLVESYYVVPPTRYVDHGNHYHFIDLKEWRRVYETCDLRSHTRGAPRQWRRALQIEALQSYGCSDPGSAMDYRDPSDGVILLHRSIDASVRRAIAYAKRIAF